MRMAGARFQHAIMPASLTGLVGPREGRPGDAVSERREIGVPQRLEFRTNGQKWDIASGNPGNRESR